MSKILAFDGVHRQPASPGLAASPSDDTALTTLAQEFQTRAARRELRVVVIGLGYVGLPLCEALVCCGFHADGLDLNPWKVSTLNEGASYLDHFPSARVAEMLEIGRFRAVQRPEDLAEADAYIICVPTPVDEHRTPDLSCVERSAEMLAGLLRPGVLVVLESTVYPGATQERLRPLLERGGLVAGVDFALAYSPERVDPGNHQHTAATTPKVVGADSAAERDMACALYGAFTEVVPVRDCKTAEAVKLSENIFRLVNISLANELKHAFAPMGVDIWEVVEAASTKPFGYMPFYPGPGVGGHCIPVDPFYLTWKARENGEPMRLVELAGDLAHEQPIRVVEATARALSDRFRMALKGAYVLVLGVAYKRDVSDARETPAVAILAELEARGAKADYHDPHVARLRVGERGLRSVSIEPAALSAYDVVILVTDHGCVDYAAVTAHARLIVDTRNALADADAAGRAKVVRA